MGAIVWHELKPFFSGVSHAAIYADINNTKYSSPWDGIISVSEDFDSEGLYPIYNEGVITAYYTKERNRKSTVEAYMYPSLLEQVMGYATDNGIIFGEQKIHPFHLAYKSFYGDGVNYRINILLNQHAIFSGGTYSTINDTPDATTFSWQLSGIKEDVLGFETSNIILDSTKLSIRFMEMIEKYLYGSEDNDPSLSAVFKLIQGLDKAAETIYGDTKYRVMELEDGIWTVVGKNEWMKTKEGIWALDNINAEIQNDITYHETFAITEEGL